MAIACKCDLDNILDLKKLHDRLTKLDIGLIKVTISNEEGKNRLRLAFDWLLRAISHNRRPSTQVFLADITSSDSLFIGTNPADASNYQNPASPEVLATPPPWEIPRSDTATPTAAMHPSSDLSHVPQSFDTHPIIPMHGSNSSTQVTGDLPGSGTEDTSTGVLDRNESQDFVDSESKSSITAVSLQADNSGTELSGLNDSTEPADDIPEDRSGIPGRIR